ncbi:peptide/nickel transport system ATP-binding protein [Halopelagius inordinatus]|uniref:Peptide/nickel transport system ATP-binding protein n=1 Tax=Halopelagius inordinatus TaxID=553467 RepID=A0A1I2VXF1_9EURY|nr:ABC transporter ATP-binding protein [Halopelagius inordinatus]SFG92001.1 peptide/nickel transport system ATP-binding protein [Halopelagius inordinatus]
MSSDSPVISVDDVSVHFSDSGGLFDLFSEDETVRAVDGISLDIGENDVVTLIGESGCGKSTLGKTIIGAQKPTSGSIKYRGQDIWEAKSERNPEIPFSDIRRSLQMIHQDPGSALNPNQRLLTTLMLPMKKWNPDLGRERRKERIFALLEKVGLSPAEDFVNRFPHQLSGGEQQRVVLVRSLLLNPDLILADEAISALDVSLRVEMMDLMLELQDLFGTSYLFISHDLSNARYIAEKSGGRIAVMYLGKIVEVGPIEQVIENPQHPYTKALKWATPNLYGDDGDETLPVREIDIPDPVNRPSGCHFHPRCPEAREVCRTQDPNLITTDGGHGARCYRADESHEYWDSPSIVDDEGELG